MFLCNVKGVRGEGETEDTRKGEDDLLNTVAH